MVIATREPSTGRLVEEFAELDERAVDLALERATDAARVLRHSPLESRIAVLRRAAELFEDDVDRLARLITLEMGRPLGAARAEVLKCATALRYYADHGPKLIAPMDEDARAVGAVQTQIRWDPLGVVLAVMPWNYPFWQVVRFAAPALLAGNAALLKHASNVPQCALALEELFIRADAPAGAFQSLLLGSGRVSGLIEDPRVAAVTFTGSESAGRQVASVAGGVIKKCVLELGGSDPFIVLPTADIVEAARVAAVSRTQNAGQSCISAKRFIVHSAVFDEFAERFVAEMASVVIGDPWLGATQMGPLATHAAQQDIQSLVDDAIGAGASLLLGGETPDKPGWFYPPTVIRGVTGASRLYTEEAFGPVATVIEVTDIEEAIQVANATEFGLSSNVWTNDASDAAACIDRLDAGGVFVNGMTASHPQLPFGGIKKSGYGRELSSFGLREFCNAKTVWIGSELV